MIKTRDEFIKSLNDGRLVYYRGETVANVAEHPILKVPVKHAASIYSLQADTTYKDIMLVNTTEYGEMSSFYKIPENSSDLMKRHRLIYETTRIGRGQFNIIKAIGSDALFALMYVSRLMDKKYDKGYYKRVMKYYRYVVDNDLALSVAQTDVKGDRSLKPSDQDDPDLYVHIVKRDNNGIYVSGAKAHTTQSIASHDIIVLPTRNMAERDRDYAVAFSTPANAPGITMISRPLKEVETTVNDGLSIIGKENIEVETVTIFDNVFIPHEKVFLDGEYDFSGILAVMFPTFHRFTAISYRAALADFLIGIGKLLAEYNGTDNKPNIMRNMKPLISYKEILRATAIAASHECNKLNGLAVPDVVYTNVGKLYANENYTDIIKNIVDIAGGLVATLPAYEDFKNPHEEKLLIKYLRGKDKDSTMERIKVLQTLREFISSMGSLYLAGMIHAEGSIEASILELYRSYKYEDSKNLGKYASNIKNEL